jgi:hypothetical protein
MDPRHGVEEWSIRTAHCEDQRYARFVATLADHCMAALPWGVVIIDESHNLRTTNSRQADSPHTGKKAAGCRPAEQGAVQAPLGVQHDTAGDSTALSQHPDLVASLICTRENDYCFDVQRLLWLLLVLRLVWCC